MKWVARNIKVPEHEKLLHSELYHSYISRHKQKQKINAVWILRLAPLKKLPIVFFTLY